MTYDNSARILGYGTVSAAAIQQWFVVLGPNYIGYAPDGRYQAPPSDLGAAIVAECQRYPDYIVNHDLVAPQILKETAAWQSRYARERNNPGGIGAVNHDPDQAIWFPSVAAGVRAHVAHLLTYAVGDGPWTADTPRYGAVKQRGWVGVAPRWTDLNGRWAWPGTTYGQDIVRLANQLLAFAAPSPKEEPPVSGLPLRVSHIPRGNGNRPGYPMTPRYITIHETANTRAGANAEMHRRFVNQGGGAEGVSWHFTVDDSEIVEHLPTTENGWHAGDGVNGTGNRESIGIELCVNSDGDFTATLALAARLVARLMETRNIPIERVVQHHHWSGKNCPTNLRRGNNWQAFIQSVRAITEREPHDPEYRHFDETGFGITRGFRGFWEQFNDDRLSIQIFGYPLSNESEWTTPDGQNGSIQYFERAVFEWHPDKGVLLRRLGADALEAA